MDHARIDRWWRWNPEANIGIATGAPGPDVLDIDRKNGKSGYPALRHAQQAGLFPPPIAAIRTPSGGAHLYYAGTGQRNGSLPAQALDFRSFGRVRHRAALALSRARPPLPGHLPPARRRDRGLDGYPAAAGAAA